jgi:hypothetical protein
VSIYWALDIEDCLLPGLGVFVAVFGNTKARNCRQWMATLLAVWIVSYGT